MSRGKVGRLVGVEPLAVGDGLGGLARLPRFCSLLRAGTVGAVEFCVAVWRVDSVSFAHAGAVTV